MGSKSRYGYRAPRPPPEWHEFRDIERSERRILSVLDLDGEVWGEDLPFDPDKALQKPFSKATREETDYTGYMGNDGLEVTHWYRSTVSAFLSVGFFTISTWVNTHCCSMIGSCDLPAGCVNELLPDWQEDEDTEEEGSETQEKSDESEDSDVVEVPPPAAASRPPNVVGLLCLWRARREESWR